MWVRETVDQLVNTHHSRCPFELAEQLKIHVIRFDLHQEINGYYKYDRRNQYIMINSNLNEQEQKVVCAHELGHAVLHPRVNTPFMRKNTFLSLSKIEREANCFAAELLIPDKDFVEVNNIYEIASLHGVPVQLVELKLFCKEGLF